MSCSGTQQVDVKFHFPNRLSVVQHFLLIQFYVPFKNSSANRSLSVGGAKTGELRDKKKTPDTPASRTWLVSQVSRVGNKPTPDTAGR